MVDIQKLLAARRAFQMPNDELRSTSAAFRYDIEHGFTDPEVSTLRLLPAYTNLPDGRETGTYIALDFGGTNIRVLRIRLLGNGCFDVEARVERPFKVEGQYDYIGEGTTADELWDFTAELIDAVVAGDKETPYKLGHTFSFPSKQTNIYDARLICWTKEFRTQGVEGEIVNDQLKAALARRGLTNIEPVAVVNDTVAALLSAAYAHRKTFIGSIIATGHNTCYLEDFGGQKTPMVINMESGNFSKLLPNPYDSRLDAASQRPGEQRMEKMVSGKYLGVLFTLALADAVGPKVLDNPFSSVDMSALLAAPDGGANILTRHTGEEFSQGEAFAANALAEEIVRRSARLIAATYAGTLWHLAGSGMVLPQKIAIEGSVYAKMPVIREALTEALYDLLGHEATGIEIDYVTDGGGLGAALAAAMVE